jgi:hypothetical protein
MSINIGEINHFIVKRKTDFSYMLRPVEHYKDEIFLHINEAKGDLCEGDEIDAFLYYDGKHRLCATMEEPLITTTYPNFVEVVSVKKHLGCFINIGISKDILLSKDSLPENTELWPHEHDLLPCILREKRDSLVCKIISKNDLEEIKLSSEINDIVECIITNFNSGGICAFTKDFEPIFIHKSLIRKRYHLGEVIYPKIINVNEDNEFNGSLIEQKEKMMITDSEMVLKTLQDLGGIIPLGDSSTPEEIAKVFPLSKKAFKRAIGALYKKHLIIIEDKCIKLNNDKK